MDIVKAERTCARCTTSYPLTKDFFDPRKANKFDDTCKSCKNLHAIKAHKIKCYPTGYIDKKKKNLPEPAKQMDLVQRHIDVNRIVKNYGVSLSKKLREEGFKISAELLRLGVKDWVIDQTRRDYEKYSHGNGELPKLHFMMDVCSSVYSALPFKQLYQAHANHWQNKSHFGAPTFKKPHQVKSFPWQQGHFEINNEGNQCYLSMLGWFNMSEKLRFDGHIKSISCSLVAGEFFISIHVENIFPEKEHGDKIIGIDIGVNNPIQIFDGKQDISYQVPDKIWTLSCKIKIINKSISKKFTQLKQWRAKYKKTLSSDLTEQEKKHLVWVKFPGKNLKKQLSLLASLYAKRTNLMDAWRKRTIAEILKTANIICMESLDVKNMIEKDLVKSKQQQRTRKTVASKNQIIGMGTTARLIVQMAKSYGVKVVFTDRFAPSTRKCSNCGESNWIEGNRIYKCKYCALKIHRDCNSARNHYITGTGVKWLPLAEQQTIDLISSDIKEDN